MNLTPLLALASLWTPAQPTTEELVASVSQQMRERYVLADVGERAAKLIESNLKKGVYKDLKEQALADRLVADLNGVCKDAHQRMRWSKDPLPARKVAAEPSEAEIKEFEQFVREQNAGFQEVKVLQGNLGYIKFNGFMDRALAQRAIDSAFHFVAETRGLIFDIRDNGGGSPDTVRAVCSYLFKDKTHLNSLFFRSGNETVDFFTEPVSGPLYADKPVWVLVSKRTGSGAEEFAYNLQTRKRATIIGQSTWGGANPGGNVRLNDHFAMFVPTGMAINPVTKKNWEGTGVIPDVVTGVGNELDKALELAK